MAVTARPKIAKSKNAVSPWSVCLSRLIRRETSLLRTLWRGSTPALDSSPSAVRHRGSRVAILGRGWSCRHPPCSINSRSLSSTHFRSTDVIHFQSIDFSDGCFQSNLTSLLRYFRLPGWFWGSGVRLKVERPQSKIGSPWHFKIFGPLPPTL